MKPQNLFAALFVLTALGTTVFAQPPRGQQGRGPGGGPPSHPIVDAIDQNQDHEISASEIANATKNLLSLDENDDGVVDQNELGHGHQPGQRGQGQRGQGRPTEGGFAAQLLEFDNNGDGELQKDELPERMQGMIERHDADGNGTLDATELQSMLGDEGGGRRGGGQREGGNRQRRGGGEGGQRGGEGGQRGGGQRGGGGGDDSRAARFVERCMEFDANDDGLLSEEELTEMASNMSQRGGGGEGGRRGGGGQRGGGGRSGGRPE